MFIYLKQVRLAPGKLKKGDSTNQNIIRLDIRMHDVGLPKEAQRQKELMSVSADSTYV
jgi:hypothetical protein